MKHSEKERKKRRRENWDKTDGKKRKMQYEKEEISDSDSDQERSRKRRRTREDQHPVFDRLQGLEGKGGQVINVSSLLVYQEDREEACEPGGFNLNYSLGFGLIIVNFKRGFT